MKIPNLVGWIYVVDTFAPEKFAHFGEKSWEFPASSRKVRVLGGFREPFDIAAKSPSDL